MKNEEIQLDRRRPPTQQFLQSVMNRNDLFDPKLIINPKFENEIATHFGVNNFLDPSVTEQFIGRILDYSEGETILLRLVTEQKPHSNLLYKYHLVEVEQLATKIVTVMVEEINNLISGDKEDFDKVKCKGDRCLRILKTILRMKVKQISKQGEGNVNTKKPDQNSQRRVSSLYRSQLKIVLRSVHSYKTTVYQRLISKLISKIHCRELQNCKISILYSHEFSWQRRFGVSTFFDKAITRPKFAIIEKEAQLYTDWAMLDFAEFMACLGSCSIAQQDIILYYMSENIKKPIYSVMYLLDNDSDCNIIDLEELKIEELWKLHISERLALLGYSQEAIKVLNQAKVDWKEEETAELIIPILLKCNRYLMAYTYVTSFESERVFKYFLEECLSLKYDYELFGTEITSNEEHYLLEFLTLKIEDLPEEDKSKISYIQSLIRFLLKRNKIQEAIRWFELLDEDQQKPVQLRLRSAIEEKPAFEVEYYRQKLPQLFGDEQGQGIEDTQFIDTVTFFQEKNRVVSQTKFAQVGQGLFVSTSKPRVRLNEIKGWIFDEGFSRRRRIKI